ncbi:MAG: hypothetical protein Q9218_007229 [Villophora microphyllina]
MFTTRSGEDYGYDALYYTWGPVDPGTDHTLTVTFVESSYVKRQLSADGKIISGGTVKIRDSLYTLLRRLKRISYDRFIWIDSVCIDQSNDAEKGTQIALMGDIYREAKHVVIWLGEASSLEEGALAIMPAVTIQLEEASAQGFSFYVVEDADRFEDFGLPPINHKVWSAFGTLMGRPWFRRQWTLQEAVLPETNPRVLCGSREIDWEILSGFGRVMFDTYSNGFMHWTLTGNHRLEPDYLHGYEALRTMEICHDILRTGAPGIPLASLVTHSRKQEASHPSDMIFGSLGMAAPGLVKEIPIDPSLPQQVVFTTFGKYYVSHKPCECLLNHTARKKKLRGLPSWCPNFASQEETTPLGSHYMIERDLRQEYETQGYCAGYSMTNEKWNIPTIPAGRLAWEVIGSSFTRRHPIQNMYNTTSLDQISPIPDTDDLRASGIVVDQVSRLVDANPGVRDF